MKNSSLLIFIILMVFTGCSDINQAFTDGYSKNPNEPTDSPPEKLFVGAETGSIQFLEGRGAQWSAIWTRVSTGADKAFAGFQSYNMIPSNFNSVFSIPYTEVRNNLNLVKNKSKELGGRENLIAVANIFGAMVMGTVTDLWGDIPYSEANKDSVSQPKYDEQTSVYTAVQQQLDTAISSLENNKKDLATGVDVFSYDGDVDKWLKAAHTLKARFYMHTGDYNKAIQSAKSGIMDLNGNQDLNIPHGNVYGGNANIYHQFLTNVTVGFMDASNTNAIPLMQQRSTRSKTDESGRLDFYYSPDRENLNVTDGAFTRESSFPLVTAIENQLILAEAYAHKGTSQDDETALNYLNEAREYNQLKFPQSTYKDLSETDFQSGGEYENTTILQEIFDEEYLSLAFQIEDFTFCRRIDYQVTGLEPVGGKDEFPERFLYPQTEINSNDNAPEQGPSSLFKPTPVNQ